MRSYRFGSAITIATSIVVLAAPLAARSAEPPADTFCPRAVPRLVAFSQASADGGKDLAKVAATSKDAAYAYELCIAEAQNNVIEEPRINYDRVRAAQFLVVEGRALAATGDPKGASQAFQDARKYADYVAKWQGAPLGTSQANNGSGFSETRTTGKVDSRYREAATAILKAADEEMAKLAPHRQAPAEAPAAPASPHP